MRAVRAAAGVAAAGLALVVGAGPARAGAPDISMSSPTGGGVVSTSTPTIAGTASATSPDGTVTGDLQVAVTSAAGHPGWSATTPACGQSSCRFSLAVSPPLLWNGAYTLSVQATETDPGGPGQPVSYEASFSVAAPPATPSGLAATPSADGRSVRLAWSEPSYPDLAGYQVSRSPSGPGFPARVTSAGYSDPATTPGTAYSYQVTALRQGASSGTTVASAPATAAVGGPPGAAGGGAASGSSSGSGSGSTGPAGSGVGTYSSAGGAVSGGATGLGGLLDPSAFGAGLPAQAAPAVPSLPPDSAEPGPDLPAVAPFSSSSSGASGKGGRPVTITYGAVPVSGHSAMVRNVAAVGLAALLLAVVAHLLWLRRLVVLAPSAEHGPE
ncbi:MAG TPA: fibronectin type III domain-containing protein [Acidimicrobiales bacterium]|nr:fibronectin type III domain-containing protein [Acidimicrobiales bacterium]